MVSKITKLINCAFIVDGRDSSHCALRTPLIVLAVIFKNFIMTCDVSIVPG